MQIQLSWPRVGAAAVPIQSLLLGPQISAGMIRTPRSYAAHDDR